jgi:hypothetical protein
MERVRGNTNFRGHLTDFSGINFKMVVKPAEIQGRRSKTSVHEVPRLV